MRASIWAVEGYSRTLEAFLERFAFRPLQVGPDCSEAQPFRDRAVYLNPNRGGRDKHRSKTQRFSFPWGGP